MYSPIATGWGTLQYGGETSDYLMKVTLKYFDWDECQEAYKNVSSRRLANGIDDDRQICAGGRNEEKDTCQVLKKCCNKKSIAILACMFREILEDRCKCLPEGFIWLVLHHLGKRVGFLIHLEFIQGFLFTFSGLNRLYGIRNISVNKNN